MKKSKQQLAEEYCNKIYQEAVGEEMYAPDVYQSKKDFIAGYDAAIASLKKPKKESFKIEEPWVDYKKEKPVIAQYYQTKIKEGGKLLNISDYFKGATFFYNESLVIAWKRKTPSE